MAKVPSLNQLTITPNPIPSSTFIKNLKDNDLLSPKKYTDLGTVGKKDISQVGELIGHKHLKTLKVQEAKSGFKFDDYDTKDKNWYPQGISYLKESKAIKTIVVSWYNKKSDYARITFVKLTDNKVQYNHVTLVEADNASSYKAIKTHAGGLAIIDDYIYVADSKLGGVRVFNANVLFEISEPDYNRDCGVISRPHALGNRYIIPEICHYKLSVGSSKMSYMSVDRSDSKQPRLLTGNFTSEAITKVSIKGTKKKYDNGPSLAALWKMKKEDGMWVIDKAEQVIRVMTKRAQGAVKFDDDFMVNRSYTDESHSIRVGKVENDTFIFSSPPAGNWPVGCEDLSYDATQDELWGVTEFPDGTNGGFRFVYCADFDKLIKKNE
jgi:hypothetical protein